MTKVNWNSSDILARARAGAFRGVVAATEEVRSEEIALILDTPKTGRMYRRRGVVHQASAPGEPPASDTGALVNSIRTEYDQAALRGTVVAGGGVAKHAPFLEYGTQHMAARPFARVALANKADAIKQRINEAVAAAVGGAG